MDILLATLCDAIKKITVQIKPQTHPASFILLTGVDAQGKSALLRQSQYHEYALASSQGSRIFYNERGVILELGESFEQLSINQLKQVLKRLNRCHHAFKISGLAVCTDINELLASPETIKEQGKNHFGLPERIISVIGYPLESFLILTKIDNLSGFAEFYQNEHDSELQKALGFSLPGPNKDVYLKRFEQLLETLNEQVISKIHPARSTIKRTLIREFPAQLSGLKLPLLAFLQRFRMGAIDFKSVFLTSAEQGGVSVDKINQKIAHEYALTLHHQHTLAANYKAYFIVGALDNIQNQSLHYPQPNKMFWRLGYGLGGAAAVVVIGLVGHHFFKTTQLLDQASKELLTYEILNTQQNKNAQALYHLNQAARTMDKIASNTLVSPTIFQLKSQIHHKTTREIQESYLPELIHSIERTISNSSETPIARYKALKVYLMLNNAHHFSQKTIIAWAAEHWTGQSGKEAENNIALLNAFLDRPLGHLVLNAQIVSDARNYLNALPPSYLYYSIAKESFNPSKNNLTIAGINLAAQQIPVYFTKKGFKEVIAQLPNLAKAIEKDNWILERQDLPQLTEMLQQAYCYDYVTWWQTFLRKSAPVHYQSYQQGQEAALLLQKNNSIQQLISVVQNQTRPDLQAGQSLFNQAIASQFTELNLMSQSATRNLGQSIHEIGQFMTTLSVVNDQGKTAFSIAKGRFSNANLSDPVSMLYTQANHFPEPVNKWVKQVADECWVLLINDARAYINQQWQRTVYRDYKDTIAKRYPLDAGQKEEIAVDDFNHFFATHGILNQFVETHIKPFLDTSQAQWQPKAADGYVMPISSDMINELIRANVITTMFFPNHSEDSKIEFTLHKITMDPIISSLQLQIGKTALNDNQNSESETHFSWPLSNAKLALDAIDGNHYELSEQGPWGIFRLLEKVNVLVDEQDSASLHILFEINGNSGRYMLKSANPINPFTPGILNGFGLEENVV